MPVKNAIIDDDADGAADDREGAGAEGHLGQEPGDLLLVADQRLRRPADRGDVELQLATEGVQRLDGALCERLEVGHPRQPVFGGTSWK